MGTKLKKLMLESLVSFLFIVISISIIMFAMMGFIPFLGQFIMDSSHANLNEVTGIQFIVLILAPLLCGILLVTYALIKILAKLYKLNCRFVNKVSKPDKSTEVVKGFFAKLTPKEEKASTEEKNTVEVQVQDEKL